MTENLYINLRDLDPTSVDLRTFMRILKNPSPENSGKIYIARVTGGGAAYIRYGQDPVVHASDSISSQFFKKQAHYWGDEYVVLINSPCFVAPASGVVLTGEGRIISDTIYPSSGKRDFGRTTGLNIKERELESTLQKSERACGSVFSPILSRWSNVYFHMLSESIVQDAVYDRIGATKDICYLLPRQLNGSQSMSDVFDNRRIYEVSNRMVSVPRVVFGTLLYKHAVIGFDFRFAMEMLKLRFGSVEAEASTTKKVVLGRKLYVSRTSATQRRMLNEKELIVALETEGIQPLEAEKLSFREQIELFSNASIIVGPHGAGLVNAAFCKPSASLYELRPLNRSGETPMWNETYRKLCATMGFSYFFDVFQNEEESDEWEVDINKVVSQVKSLS
ncbi:hypothetical protein GGE65_000763 [Skermanella aerolata]|uniref:glycosyltransferase family 61 protein n=1 Tax=Skermanella aerolata TaxID=393310 RepID=UPI003D1E5B1A